MAVSTRFHHTQQSNHLAQNMPNSPG